MNEFSKPTVLIADPDLEFLEGFRHEAQYTLKVQVSSERRDAQLKIADKSAFMAAICVNLSLCEPYALPLIKFAKAHRPATPIFLLKNHNAKSPDENFIQALKVQGMIEKPTGTRTLINTIFPYTLFEMEKLVDLSKLDESKVDSTLTAADQEMHSISAKDFLCGSKSFFDVYVRIGSGKYIKLLKSGDQFDAERVKVYLDKGVTHFYMKKEAQELFMRYCDKLTETLLSKASVSVEVKADQVLNLGKETMDYLKERGINEMTIGTSLQFVKHAQSLTSQIKSDVLNSFLNKIGMANHGSGTLMILSLLIDGLGYRDKKTVEVIALAGLFHDIGLMKLPEHFQNERIEDMTDEELIEFHKHPEIGKSILKGIRRINPIVPQVVLQHHERRNRSGFPLNLGPGAISPVSELVGIADTFNQLIRKQSAEPNIDPVKVMEKEHFNSFSFPIIEAFQKVFKKKNPGS